MRRGGTASGRQQKSAASSYSAGQHHRAAGAGRRCIAAAAAAAAAGGNKANLHVGVGHLGAGLQDFKLEAPVHPRGALSAADASDNDPQDVEEFDILGVGQLMVDWAAAVDDAMLAELNVPKGGRRVISVEERAAVMERLQGYDCQVSAGGSLANTLVAISQLAAARERALRAATAPGKAGAPTTTTSSSSSSTRRIRVAMAGCCGGSDALGEFARAQMAAAGVEVVPLEDDDARVAGGRQSADGGGAAPAPVLAGSATGTVMVFSTPDAQRSFLSSFPADDALVLTPRLLAAVARARVLVLEGYCWELPGAAEMVPALVAHARAVGTLVVLTAGDASVVQRHAGSVLAALQAGVDVFVANVAEAQQLVQHVNQQQQQQHLHHQQQQQAAVLERLEQLEQQHQQQQQQQQQLPQVQLTPQGSASLDSMWDAAPAGAAVVGDGQAAACQLAGICPMCAVTDGSRGSYVTALGQLIVVPPFWRSLPPIDTTGAGDGWAGGLLFAFLLGLDLHAMGHLAAKTASAVISRRGPQLLAGDADWVAAATAQRDTARRPAGGVLEGVRLPLGSLGGGSSQALQGAGT